MNEQCSETCLPTAPDDIDTVKGDMILILSLDKAALHRWPIDSEPYFEELHHYDKTVEKFNFNDFYALDGCSVQFKGESYLIGGSYHYEEGYNYCDRVNGRRAVMRVAKEKCGLD